MNLEEQWKNMEKEDEDLSSLLNRGIVKSPSKDPLEKIKRNLLINAFLGMVIAAGYIVVFFYFPVWQVLLSIGIVFVFTVWAVIKTLFLYRDLQKKNNGSSVLQEMERHYNAIQTWSRIQLQAGLFIYPVSAAGGFMVGGTLGSGKPISEFMQKPFIILTLLITIVILVPICFYFAKWMCKKAFGVYAHQLKENIDRLKAKN
ncbi:MAG: hypothetical protein EKK37_00535 [Sphingobacteriales bacterium]|nr:MAG: hypothetical protein EKK37_00535 [Sphingobacteriales bacterium]